MSQTDYSCFCLFLPKVQLIKTAVWLTGSKGNIVLSIYVFVAEYTRYIITDHAKYTPSTCCRQACVVSALTRGASDGQSLNNSATGSNGSDSATLTRTFTEIPATGGRELRLGEREREGGGKRERGERERMR